MIQKTSFISDFAWQIMQGLINQQRKSKWELKMILEAILYVLKTGCQWRHLPPSYPPWQTVYWYFRKWEGDGTIELVQKKLHQMIRKQKDRPASPSLGILDSQSVRTTSQVGEARGFDGNKKIKGRKRQLIVDSLGYAMTIMVHAAHERDSKAAEQIIGQLHEDRCDFPRLEKILADQGYRGELINKVKKLFGWNLEIVKRKSEEGFQIKSKRWIVERTFAWLDNFRRLCRDFEKCVESSVAFIQLAMIFLIAKRIVSN